MHLSALSALSAALLLSALAPVATAVPVAPRDAHDAVPTTHLYFRKDFTQSASGDIGYDDEVQVHYDLDRAFKIYGATLDTPETTITAFYSLNNAPAVNFTLFDNSRAPSLASPLLVLSAQHALGTLSLWFTCKTGTRPAKYDSAYGKNYNFQLSGTVLAFNKDFTTSQTGQPLKAGRAIEIRYDPARMPCKVQQGNETAVVQAYALSRMGPQYAWNATVYWQGYDAGRGLVKETAKAVIPPACVVAGEMWVYFECETTLETGFDSAYGRNWRFEVAA
ncbi:hypothetical protein HDU96_002686 [Phlyctochytrium bullatum]|nr:hypothetical protein HDU96_002686 [Phlyctochytrium bullatum]